MQFRLAFDLFVVTVALITWRVKYDIVMYQIKEKDESYMKFGDMRNNGRETHHEFILQSR